LGSFTGLATVTFDESTVWSDVHPLSNEGVSVELLRETTRPFEASRLRSCQSNAKSLVEIWIRARHDTAQRTTTTISGAEQM
jgi:hypothetical protein